MNGGHPPEHDDSQQPRSAVEDPSPPERPDAEDCPFCSGQGTLQTALEAGLSALGATRRPTVVHVTECTSCGASRRVEVDVESLGGDTEAVSGGMWDRPGQGTLDDHQ